MITENFTVAFIGDGEVALSTELGQTILLDKDIIASIVEQSDFNKVKKRLLADPIISESQENKEDIDTIVEYYIAKRDQMEEVLHESVFLAHALHELDIDDLEREAKELQEKLGEK